MNKQKFGFSIMSIYLINLIDDVQTSDFTPIVIQFQWFLENSLWRSISALERRLEQRIFDHIHASLACRLSIVKS